MGKNHDTKSWPVNSCSMVMCVAVCLELTIPTSLDAVVFWCADVGDADQRREPLPRGGPLWHNTLLAQGQEATAATVLPWPFVSIE